VTIIDKQRFYIAEQYIRVSRGLFESILSSKNKMVVISDHEPSDDELYNATKDSSMFTILPALFCLYQGIELLLKGFVCLKSNERLKHKAEKLIEMFFVFYPGATSLGELFIKLIEKPEPFIDEFVSLNKIKNIEQLYTSFRYPENNCKQIDYTPLKYPDDKAFLAQIQNICNDIKQVLLLSVSLFHSLEDKSFKNYTAEFHIDTSAEKTVFSFRKQNRNLSFYIPELPDEEPLTDTLLDGLVKAALIIAKVPMRFMEITVSDIIRLTAEPTDDSSAYAFAEAFIEALEAFYEENEVHITRMFGSFVYLKKTDGQLRAVKATPIPIQYCPLMKQLLTEVGGETAEKLLASAKAGDAASQPETMCRLINEVVIKGGYFDTARPLNSCEANVLFGASETMSSAFKHGLIDAVVIVSNNLGTIITTNESNTQGAVKRMTGLFLTSPSRQIVKTAREAGIIPVFPHTAIIDQREGVRMAIALGYKNIAVSLAWKDNALLGELDSLETNGVTLYKFGLCSTGIDDTTAEAMEKHADLIWSCASKAVRTNIAPNAIAQVGIKIPVHIMTEKGWRLVKNHLEETDSARTGHPVSYDGVICEKGTDKPVILNGDNRFTVLAAKDLLDCTDCPHPCI